MKQTTKNLREKRKRGKFTMSSHASPPLSINVNHTNSVNIQDYNMSSEAARRSSPRSFIQQRSLNYANNNPNTDFDCMTILRCDPKSGKINSNFSPLIISTPMILHLNNIFFVGENNMKDEQVNGRRIVTAEDQALTIRVGQSYPVQFPKRLVEKDGQFLVLKKHKFKLFDFEVKKNKPLPQPPAVKFLQETDTHYVGSMTFPVKLKVSICEKEDESKTMPIKCEEYVNGHLSNSFMWFKVAARVIGKNNYWEREEFTQLVPVNCVPSENIFERDSSSGDESDTSLSRKKTIRGSSSNTTGKSNNNGSKKRKRKNKKKKKASRSKSSKSSTRVVADNTSDDISSSRAGSSLKKSRTGRNVLTSRSGNVNHNDDDVAKKQLTFETPERKKNVAKHSESLTKPLDRRSRMQTGTFLRNQEQLCADGTRISIFTGYQPDANHNNANENEDDFQQDENHNNADENEDELDYEADGLGQDEAAYIDAPTSEISQMSLTDNDFSIEEGANLDIGDNISSVFRNENERDENSSSPIHQVDEDVNMLSQRLHLPDENAANDSGFNIELVGYL